MDVEYCELTADYLQAIIDLQDEWLTQNTDLKDAIKINDFVKYQKEYCLIALANEIVIGYVLGEVIDDNQSKFFLKGSQYLTIRQFYVVRENNYFTVGETLLSLIEKKARKHGIVNFLIANMPKDGDILQLYKHSGYVHNGKVFYKRSEWDVQIYKLNELTDYRFVVVFARYQGQWLYCRHKSCKTYETPGGHIEIGETPLEAAKRELYEETGALEFGIYPCFDYAVYRLTDFSNGQAFYAEVTNLGNLPASEIAEVIRLDTLPKQMTYPEILPIIYSQMQMWLIRQSGSEELWDVYNQERKLTGRVHKRGELLAKGDYHLIVHVWIVNSEKKILITKRSANKGYSHMWGCTGGSALIGEDSLRAALRETKEETGIELVVNQGKCLFTVTRKDNFCDVWLFKREVEIEQVVLQPEETCDAMWVTIAEIRELLKAGKFVSFVYLESLFTLVSEIE